MSDTQRELLRRAQRIFVGGTLGEFHLPDDVAVVFERAAPAASCTPSTAAEYIDYLLGSGPMILGHCHPAVVAAVSAQVQRGTTFFLAFGTHHRTGRADRRRCSVRGADPLRQPPARTAVAFAVRMARAFTGRRKVLRFEGGWHGVSDFGLHGARPPRPSDYPRASADSAGLPASLADDILVAPFNDAAMAAQIIERHGAELAAVCVEPLQRCIRPRPEFLRTVREATAQSGSILIFDEVVTGFRIAWGGAQERYGVVPDLATYGKTVSGGYPAAAICGRADVLDTVNPWRDPSQIRCAPSSRAPSTAIRCPRPRGWRPWKSWPEPGTYERLDALADRLRQGIERLGRELSIPLLVGGDGPVLQVLFTTDSAIENYRSMLYADRGKAYRFGIEMIRRGFFISPYEKIYLSTAHTDEDLDRTLAAMAEVMPLLAD